MPSTYQSIHINAPIDTVWEIVSHFHDMSWTPNVISSCEAVGDTHGREPGAKRILNEAFHETLHEVDLGSHTVRYSIDDGPSPVSANDVTNYYGEIHLVPVTASNSTVVEWKSSWESDSEDAVEFCSTIYSALLGELATTLEQQ
jgi:hypothetical protein